MILDKGILRLDDGAHIAVHQITFLWPEYSDPETDGIHAVYRVDIRLACGLKKMLRLGDNEIEYLIRIWKKAISQ